MIENLVIGMANAENLDGRNVDGELDGEASMEAKWKP